MPGVIGDLRGRFLKPIVFVACLIPLALLVWNGVRDALGANPVEAVTRETGRWTLYLLFVTLAVTPLRRATGWNALQRLRRMLGLFAFFYAALHFTTYVWLDAWFDLAVIAEDIVKRPYITVGFSAFVLLIPLAVTSTDAMQNRLRRNWQRLHRLVYAIGVLAVLHFWWLVKIDITEPARFALALGVLFAARLVWWRRRRRRAAVGCGAAGGVGSGGGVQPGRPSA